MALYETLKQIIYPDITIWQSNVVTILFATLCAVSASYFILKKHIQLVDMLNRKNEESKLLHIKLRDTIVRLELSLSEVKKLSGLLPVCSWCKKIRDDEGYWKKLEVYSVEHSNISFNHSICPDCAERQMSGLNQKPHQQNKENIFS